jgi:hypothetical protein
MKRCSQCKEEKPLSEYGLYPNGNPLAHCKTCHNAMSDASRAKNVPKSRVDPCYTEMRHPDPAFMEANVVKLIKIYADNETKIKQAGLGFEPNAGTCDLILRNSF